MTTDWTRRRVLAAALATGAAVPLAGLGAGRAAAAPAPGAARITLPRPTGPYEIGTVSLHLVDPTRPVPVAGQRIELMASIWYPAAPGGRHLPVVPWLEAGPMRALLVDNGFPPEVPGPPPTVARYGAPVLRAAGRRPVVLFSHSAAGHRSETTIAVQELASHGYVVVTVDSPFDSYGQLPDGRLVVPDDDMSITPWDHAHDVRFVLDRIEALVAGRNPDVEHRPLPAGLGAAFDLDRIGMFGWSKGATATALVMDQDERVRAGLSLDGPMQSGPEPVGVDRPFMLMTAYFTRAGEPAVADFWSQLRGWRLNVQVDGAPHGGYCDHQWLIPQIARIIGLSDEQLAEYVGHFDPARSVKIQQAYPLAFFDLHLRHQRQRLLEGPSRAFPEVRYLP
jgi:dienelactone hydrolase